MSTEVVNYNYTDIKEAYKEVKVFLEQYTIESVNDLTLRIDADLRICGDENYFLLVDFIQKYDLNFDEFEYNKHFYSEGFVGVKTLIYGLFILPFRLFNYIIIRYLSNNLYCRIDDRLNRGHYKKDLTFADMVLSKVRGEFSLRKDFKVVM